MSRWSLLLLKDKPGSKAPHPRAVQPTRERICMTHPRAHESVRASLLPPTDFIRTMARRSLDLQDHSSATAHVGDVVDLHVAEEVSWMALSVIPRAPRPPALVTEAEPKKRLGHSRKLAFISLCAS